MRFTFRVAVRRKPGYMARLSPVKPGRGERIRTSDLLNPIQTRYQAAPRPAVPKSNSYGANGASAAKSVAGLVNYRDCDRREVPWEHNS